MFECQKKQNVAKPKMSIHTLEMKCSITKKQNKKKDKTKDNK